MRIYKKSKLLGTYPSCDHLNVALRFLFKNPKENRKAIEEICYAIIKANGYFYEDIANKIKQEGLLYEE